MLHIVGSSSSPFPLRYMHTTRLLSDLIARLEECAVDTDRISIGEPQYIFQVRQEIQMQMSTIVSWN